MDGRQFDRLAKTLHGGTNRRALVAGFGASVLAVLFGIADSSANRKHHRARAQEHHEPRDDQKPRKRQIGDQKRRSRKRGKNRRGSAKRCRRAGHPCAGNRATRCCKGLACRPSSGKSAHRCSRCARGTVVHNGTCCTPDNTAACAGRDCGTAINNCNQSVSCGDPCPPPPDDCPDGTVTCGSDCFPTCCPGTSSPCYSGPAGTKNVGICRAGIMQCTNEGTWGPCAGEVTPAAETCDGRDNDCDGSVDEDFDLHNNANHCGRCGHVCPGGTVCQGGACKAVCDPFFTCDCGTCSGRGCCTEACTCRCDEGWTGVQCDVPTDSQTCADVVACGECMSHLSDGCTWCAETLAGEVGVCTSTDQCLVAAEVCPA